MRKRELTSRHSVLPRSSPILELAGGDHRLWEGLATATASCALIRLRKRTSGSSYSARTPNPCVAPKRSRVSARKRTNFDHQSTSLVAEGVPDGRKRGETRLDRADR
jgi:hypothetical protein